MKRLRNNQSGFSLVEVISSMTVFAIAAAGLAGTTVSTIKANGISRRTVSASALVHDKIEQLRSMDPNDAPADFVEGHHQDSPVTATGEPGGSYTRSWIVNHDTPSRGIAEVIVAVAWTDSNGVQNVSASTFVCQTDTCS